MRVWPEINNLRPEFEYRPIPRLPAAYPAVTVFKDELIRLRGKYRPYVRMVRKLT
jgi:hypothetical protein